MSATDASVGRYDGIQVLRLVAAALVVVTHATFYTSERLDPSLPVWGTGGIGVDIFFIISGFVIVISSRSLVARADGWKHFAMRRFVRVAPMYWIATTVKLLTMIVLPGLALHAALTPTTVVASYLFLPSRNIDGNLEPLLGVGWTLIFEAFFYVVFSVGMRLRLNPTIFASAVLGAFALGFVWRPSASYPAWTYYFDPVLVYFIVGMAFAHLVLRPAGRAWMLGIVVALAGAAFSWVAILHIDLGFERGDPYRMMIATLVVAAVIWVEPLLRRTHIPGFLTLGGDASYSIYLFHPMIGPIVPALMAAVGLQLGLVSVLGVIAIALIGGCLAFLIIERPVTLWLRERLPYAGRVRNAPPSAGG